MQRLRQWAIARAMLGMMGLAWVPGCGSEQRATTDEDREAALLVRYEESIDGYTTFEARLRQVDALANLALDSAELRETRDLCANAHRMLIRAEMMQSEVRGIIESLEAEQAGIPVDVRAELQRKLAESSRHAQTAGELLPQCKDQVAALARQLRTRR